ncbi:MBL fold metallo-hydrolase [Aminobacter sp. AP02]|uniref:MBL fold metallo-hydrolase n=1 Tax=Aminobacter sp. AP02 TaxID=2135737 RepID=UPI000D6CD51C|nr:MBL fold metallo-hydrolase [Aminobacter sp. AP02]PWK58053.1 glyoxylase-like metal-dependent hydrolase (beta-lactamase superfamily II) [Aminobacter sp. AP02]
MPMHPPGFYKTHVGEFTVTALHDGVIVRDRPSGFIKDVDEATIETVLSQAGFGPGKLVLTFTAFAVESDGQLLLIDAGFGENGPATTGKIGANLDAAGYSADDIDGILISHFHADHIAGLITKEGTPAYPGAAVYVPAPEWNFWMSDDQMTRAPAGLQQTFQLCRKVFGALGNVRKFAWGDEILPGISSVKAPGHTPGMTAFDIRSQGERLLYVADVSNNPTVFAHHPDWQAIFDIDGLDAVATRKKLFDEVAGSNVRIAYFHAPFPGLGFVARVGETYTYLPQVWGVEAS